MQQKVDRKMKMLSLFFDKFGAMFDEKVVFLFIEYCDRLTQWADFLGC